MFEPCKHSVPRIVVLMALSIIFVLSFLLCSQIYGHYVNLTSLISKDTSNHQACSIKGQVKYIFHVGNKWRNMPDDVSQCSDTCKVTSRIDNADIVLWQIHADNRIPILKKDQVLIAFGLEPQNASLNLFLLNQVSFKSSFRLDYEIPFLYFDHMFIEKVRAMKVPSLETFNGMKDVLFISSNCAEKERIDFVRRLSKIVNVDSLGACENPGRRLYGDWKRIDKLTFEKYKFYIGYEKDLTNDYVSEKFQTGFLINSVPIYKGPKRALEYAPGENSFVNVDDFNTPEELGHYLKDLMTNYTSWKAYFDYRSKAVSEETKNFSEWLNRMKFSLSGRNRGNLCRYCDHVCASA